MTMPGFIGLTLRKWFRETETFSGQSWSGCKIEQRTMTQEKTCIHIHTGVIRRMWWGMTNKTELGEVVI